MNEKEILQNLLVELQKDNKNSLWLYFVIRQLKNGQHGSEKVLDKHDFVLRRIDLSKEMKIFFKGVLEEQLDTMLSNTEMEMMEYQVIGDDLKNKIYTYALNNALSFADVINNQLVNPTKIKPINSLSEIKENLWAYCIKVHLTGMQFYSFRKTSKGKIATEKPQGLEEKITTWFDFQDAELKPFKGELANFDNKIDCLYYENKFYVFKKGSFEQIVGLEEEFLENAKNVLTVLRGTDLIEGLDILEEKILESKGLLQTLASISKKGNHSNLDSDEINKMKQVLMRFEGKDLKLNSHGKILIEDSSDIKTFAKLLNDFYKQGMISGKFYGTNSGLIVTEKH